MNVTPPTAKARARHRRAAQLGVAGFRIGGVFDGAQINNGGLIFRGFEPAWNAKNPGFEDGGGLVMCGRLNTFFAISVNSPSMSMVNFSCCVCSAPNTGARGVARRVTPQPMRAAVRMEAGADACV